MILILGSECAACGATEDLTFDCIQSCGHAHHRLSAPERISFYRKQLRAGNVQLLCASCNSLKGEMTQERWLSAVGKVRSAEAIQRATGSPGKGPAWFPSQRHEMLRYVVTVILGDT
jgi:hypothetical protein